MIPGEIQTISQEFILMLLCLDHLISVYWSEMGIGVRRSVYPRLVKMHHGNGTRAKQSSRRKKELDVS